MKSRFDHPSSAISLPSLHSSSDINERLERNSLPGNCFINHNWNINSKESKHNLKKVHNKNKRFHKQTPDINNIRNSNCHRLCKITSINNQCKTMAFHRETKKDEENIDNEKLKKDAANAMTQSGSNLLNCRGKVNQIEEHLQLPSKENKSGESSNDEKTKGCKIGIESSGKECLFPEVVKEEFINNKRYSTLTSKTGLNRNLFFPGKISERLECFILLFELQK